MKRVSTAVIFMNEMSVLLGYHLKRQGWEPPGGKQDGEESRFECACREAEEECGLCPTELKHIGVFECSKYVCLVYKCRAWTGKVKCMEPKIHREWKWFPIVGLPSLTMNGRQALELLWTTTGFGSSKG